MQLRKMDTYLVGTDRLRWVRAQFVVGSDDLGAKPGFERFLGILEGPELARHDLALFHDSGSYMISRTS